MHVKMHMKMHMKKVSTIVFGATLGAGLAGFPLSSLGASHFKIVFIDQYDRDMDGKVSSVEFEAARRERYDITDDNGNGIVDAEEYVFEYENRLDAQLAVDRREQVQQTSTRFSSLDDDGDAIISRAEYEASGMWSFERFDSNSDDRIDSMDVDPMAGAVAEEDETLSREEILHDTRRVLSMPSTHSLEGTIAQYDSDGDEVVTLAEFSAQREKNYRRMDENGDGAVNADEYLAEFEDRLDMEIASDRKGQVEQTYVRFEVLDRDDNGAMTFEEYQYSGHRSFTRYDTDGDGFVTLEEADPEEPEFTQEQVDAENQSA